MMAYESNNCDTPSEGELFGVIVEGWNQGPILWEAEAKFTSRESAEGRLRSLVGSGGSFFRGCIVRLEYVTGNEAVLHAMKGCQK